MDKLTLIQNELKAPKNQYNSFGKYKYRSCESILEAVKPLLVKHECSLRLTDEIKESGDITYVECKAIFRDNESVNTIESKAQAGIDPNRKGMDIAQSFGSSSSYARKFALSALFLLDDSKEIDAEKPIEKPKFTPKHDKWKGAIEALKSGDTTVQWIKERFELSSDDENKLLDAAI